MLQVLLQVVGCRIFTAVLQFEASFQFNNSAFPQEKAYFLLRQCLSTNLSNDLKHFLFDFSSSMLAISIDLNPQRITAVLKTTNPN